MKELYTEIRIDAPADRVWKILTDFPRFPDWNPLIKSAAGRVREGEVLKVRIDPPGQRGMVVKPTVTRVDPPREFRWIGRLFAPGIFTGEHIFRLEPGDGEAVRFVHRERFGGFLVPFFWKTLDTHTRRGFEAMNRALKERAEAGVERSV